MSEALVLLSGGMDSAVCLFEAVSRRGAAAVEAVFFDWGQLAREPERACCLALCGHAGVAPPIEVALDFPYTGPLTDESVGLPSGRTAAEIEEGDVAPTFFPGRNIVMLASAFGIAAHRGMSEIYMGATGQDEVGYPDCRKPFLEAMGKACRLGIDRDIRFETPLIGMSKTQVVERGEKLGVPWDLTFSCYAPAKGLECGVCDSCVLRIQALRPGRRPQAG